MEDLELCIVKFNPDGTIKLKRYLENYFVESEEYRPVILLFMMNIHSRQMTVFERHDME